MIYIGNTVSSLCRRRGGVCDRVLDLILRWCLLFFFGTTDEDLGEVSRAG
jgi:hypothetical protein